MILLRFFGRIFALIECMKEIYTRILLLLLFVLSCICGPGLSEGMAQSGCGIEVTWFNPQSEKLEDGILYKKVQVVVNNPNPGVGKKFYFLFDNNDRDLETLYYAYGSQTDEFWVPVTTNKITFYDFNNSTCNVVYIPDLKPNVCTFNVHADWILSQDCFHRTVTYSVDPGIIMDSVAWLVNGNTVPVHDQMSWENIPPGSYEVFFFDTAGCEASTIFSTCATKANAGEDQVVPYCLGEGDTINLFDHLSPGVDSGQFYTEFFTPLDSSDVTQLTWDITGELRYYYIIPATLEIPDTALITVNVRDCSVCEYVLVSAQRHCSDPTNVEITIGGGRPSIGDTTFLVTLPDGSSRLEEYYNPFRIEFPSYQDTLWLPVHTDTPSGVCDSTIMVGVFPDPMVRITAQEVELAGDSVGVSFSIAQGVAPYEVDVFLGNQQRSAIVQEGQAMQLSFIKNSDTAMLMAIDAMGCMGTDTLLLTPDCIRPDAVLTATSCGQENGRIIIDPASLPAGRTITWMDTNEPDLWERSGLAPGTYYYTVTYEDCMVEEDVYIDASTSVATDVLALNACLLDGDATFYVQDSGQIVQWGDEDNVLPYFSAQYPANEDHIFYIETIDGCVDTVTVRVDEPFWLNQIEYQAPNRLASLLGVDINVLTDFGWKFQDSTLCNPCGDYESESMLDAGTYTFFAEQGPGCRQDTSFIIKQDEHYFLMPNVISPGGIRNQMIQIFDPLDQMHSIMEFQVYDRFGNILFEKHDFYPDDNSSINWPNGMATELPDVIICVAKIKCKDDEEVLMAQDVLILR